ncbi:GTP binding protein [Tanacetum coccineum]
MPRAHHLKLLPTGSEKVKGLCGIYVKEKMKKVNQNSEWVTVSISNLNPSIDDWIGVFSPANFSNLSPSIDDWIGVFSPANFSDSICSLKIQALSPLYLCSAPIQAAFDVFTIEPTPKDNILVIHEKVIVHLISVLAALDVFTIEPPPKDNMLVNHENVTVTPHLDATTMEGVAIEIPEAVGGALKARARCYCIEAHIYAEENGLFFMETSVKTVVNVNEVFHEIVPETIVLSETAKIMPRAQLTQNPVGMVLVDRPAEGAHAANELQSKLVKLLLDP